MNNTGGLIELHFHNNLELLEKLSVKDNKLCYNDIPIVSISQSQDNCIELKEDGLFVNINTEELILLREQNALLSELLDIVNRTVIT